jgi:hypothetical protein
MIGESQLMGRKAEVLFCPSLRPVIRPIADSVISSSKWYAAAAPRRHPKYHLVTSDRLYALGIELMDGAVTDADAAKHMSKAHAFQYRDGLIIALLRVR